MRRHDARGLLDEVGRALPCLLGRNLVGIYPYGSLTQAAFDPRRSDIDAIVVTRRRLTRRQFAAVGAWLRRSRRQNPWTRRLQLSFLLKSRLLTMNADACLYQFGKLARTRSDGNPIVWMNVLERGAAIVGPPPRSFVPPITDAMLDAALARELAYLRAEIVTKRRSRWRHVRSYRIYAVLTICRILYSLRTRTIASKPVAARWARGRVPAADRALIDRALSARMHRSSPPPALADIRRFIDVASRRLHDRRG